MNERPEAIEQMLANRRLETVAVSIEHALDVIETAERHVSTARTLSQMDDHAMTFTASYDAARKALTAVLAAQGLRIRPVGGAHRNTGLAAREFVPDDALGEFEWMRQVRNASEYPDPSRPTATKQDVAEAVDAADSIVSVCAQYLRGLDGPEVSR